MRYKVMLLPLLEGAVHVTVAVVLVRAVAVPMVGIPGVVYGVTVLLLLEYEPVPTALIAATWNV